MSGHITGRALALLLALTTTLPAVEAQAQDRERLGYGRLLNNDYLGDGEDRWRTGSWTSSRVWGRDWSGSLPEAFGDLLELRVSSQIIAPDNLGRPAAGDRPYAGVLSAGVHTHFEWRGFNAAMGADLVMTGPDTGLGSFQREVHKALDVRAPSQATLDGQIPNGLHLTLVGEMGRDLALAPNIRLRPFVELRAGAETLARAGVDLTFGTLGRGGLMVREDITGHRYGVIQGQGERGFSFLLGADLAKVSDSIYLPEEDGFTLTENRDRLRAGVHWQGDGASAFYGISYLGEEFTGQSEGQVIGSLSIKMSF